MPFYEVSVAYAKPEEDGRFEPYKKVSVASHQAIGLVFARALEWVGKGDLPKVIRVRQYDSQMNQVDEVARYHAS